MTQETPSARSASSEPLTEHVQEILTWIARGLTNKGITNRLHLTEGAAINYTSVIVQKLGVQDRTQADQGAH